MQIFGSNNKKHDFGHKIKLRGTTRALMYHFFFKSIHLKVPNLTAPLRAPEQGDPNDTFRTYIDDLNNEVKTDSDSLYISTEENENVLKQNDNKFSILRLDIQSQL